jgi:hypothetical protein
MFISLGTRPGAPRCLLALSAQLGIAADHLPKIVRGQKNRRKRRVFRLNRLTTKSYLGNSGQLGSAVRHHCFRIRRRTVATSMPRSSARSFATLSLVTRLLLFSAIRLLAISFALACNSGS